MKAGVTNLDQQVIIIEQKLKDLYIVHELDEFVHIEKEIPVNVVNVNI